MLVICGDLGPNYTSDHDRPGGRRPRAGGLPPHVFTYPPFAFSPVRFSCSPPLSQPERSDVGWGYCRFFATEGWV